MIFWLSAALIAAAMVCGGATKSGYIGDVFVQLIAVCLILANVWLWAGAGKGEADRKLRRSSELPLWLGFAVFILTMAVQLFPMPHLYGADWLWVRNMPVETGELTPNEAWWGGAPPPPTPAQRRCTVSLDGRGDRRQRPRAAARLPAGRARTP